MLKRFLTRWEVRGGAHGQIKERMWPSAGDTFHSFHALIAIRKVSVCFYCIQHRHCRPKLWLYSLIFLVLQQFSSCSEPTTRSRPVPINSSSVKLFPAWSFKILFCGEQDAKKLRFKPKPSPDCWTIKPKPWRTYRAKRGKKLRKNTEPSTAWRAVLSPQKITAMSIRQPLCKVPKVLVWSGLV